MAKKPPPKLAKALAPAVMSSLLGMPAQVRLASRERQPPAMVVPPKKRKVR